MTRLGFKPNRQEGAAFLILFLPDGSTALYQSQEKMTDHARKESIKVGAIVHQLLPENAWKYRFEGNMPVARNLGELPRTREHLEPPSSVLAVSMDLSLTPISDVYEYSEHMTAESRELGKKAGDAHWEQIGKIDGKITLSDDTISIQGALGQRDHSHGVRDWTGIGDWLYYVVWFSEDLAINPAAITADDGRVSTGGFIFENGKNVPIKAIRILDQKFRNGVFPVSSKLELDDDLCRRHVLEGKTGPVVPISFTDKEGKLSVLAQSFGTFKLDGVSGGYGSFETLRKARLP